MYEEIQIKKRIDWKKAFTKLGVLVIVIFIVCLVMFNPGKESYAETDFSKNLKALVAATKTYYTEDKLPSSNGNISYVKLSTLIEENLIDKSVNLESDSCNKEQSYAKVTKINNKEYSLVVYLECKSENASSIDTIKLK